MEIYKIKIKVRGELFHRTYKAKGWSPVNVAEGAGMILGMLMIILEDETRIYISLADIKSYILPKQYGQKLVENALKEAREATGK